MTTILFDRAKPAAAEDTFFKIVSADFGEPTLNVDYLFQFRYRSMSIKEYFTKELLFGLAMVIQFSFISDDYRVSFMGPQIYICMETADTPCINDCRYPNTNSPGDLVITESGGIYDFTNETLKPQITDIDERVSLMTVN